MLVICFGVNHKTAELSLREKFALSPTQLDNKLRELFEKFPAAEFLLLSTCNRTELYIIRSLHGHPRNEEVTEFFSAMTGLEQSAFAESLYVLQDSEAVAQMFAVAAGLDSMVPGESQIVSQLKQALAAAQRLQVARANMTTLVAEALHVAKHVRSETGIAQGKVSVASVALELIANRFKTLAGMTVLSVGAGKMNEIILQTLRTMLPSELLITNRSPEKATELAESCGGKIVPFEALAELVGRSDIIITSTASQSPIITCDMLASLPPKERLFVDMAVPRDIQADAELLDGVELYNIDDLNGTVSQTLDERFKHVEQAE
ncbi:MAG TPA: glutamyl-tRNA reductase, partial [Phycisphaerae bacterium]|nr:glutamyl-tRNA reductase [Phycisphaerae bacterium]